MAWQKSTEIYTDDDNSCFPIVLFGNSYTGQYGYIPAPGGFVAQPFSWRAWQTVDATLFGVAADAKWIELGGIPIITGAADLMLAFRASPESIIKDWTWYEGQLLSAFSAGGERNSLSETVPLKNGTFQYCFNAKNYPDDGMDLHINGASAVGWNLKLKKWAR